MAEGEFALARQHLEEGLKHTAEWVGDHDLHVMLADAAVQGRALPALRKYAPLAEEFAVRYDHVLYRAIAGRAFGVLHRLQGDFAGARARLDEALELFHRLDTRWQIGRTWAELGELARSQADTVGARDCLSRALAAFEELGAAPAAARTRAVLETAI